MKNKSFTLAPNPDLEKINLYDKIISLFEGYIDYNLDDPINDTTTLIIKN